MLKLVRTPPADGGYAPRDELLDVAREAIAGNAGAQRALLATLSPHILRVVRQVLGGTDCEVEDVAQEAAVAILDGLRRFRGEARVLSFAQRVAMLIAIGARRRRLALKRGQPESMQDEPEDNGPNPEARLMHRQSVRAVRDLMGSLPEPQAEVLGLHCVLGFTVSEIASLTSAPDETVRSRLKLARRALRQQIQNNSRLRDLFEGVS